MESRADIAQNGVAGIVCRRGITACRLQGGERDAGASNRATGFLCVVEYLVVYGGEILPIVQLKPAVRETRNDRVENPDMMRRKITVHAVCARSIPAIPNGHRLSETCTLR